MGAPLIRLYIPWGGPSRDLGESGGVDAAAGDTDAFEGEHAFLEGDSATEATEANYARLRDAGRYELDTSAVVTILEDAAGVRIEPKP